MDSTLPKNVLVHFNFGNALKDIACSKDDITVVALYTSVCAKLFLSTHENTIILQQGPLLKINSTEGLTQGKDISQPWII